MKKLFCSLVASLVLFTAGLAHAFDVELAWNASPSQDIKEYVIYWDTSSGTPKGNSLAVGTDLTGIIQSLVTSTMYYFHVTAKDWEGRESGPSNEVRTDGIDTPDSGNDPVAPGGCYIRTIIPD